MQASIINNSFVSNTAHIAGGAIEWSKDMPEIDENNFFTQNSAEYGSNIAAYPIRLLVNIHNKDTYLNPDDNVSLIANGLDNVSILLQNISSGNDFPFVIVCKMMDLYGNIVELDTG